ncbi:GntR family transcriptional regulator [Rhodococcus sp. NPDC060084]|uniref:GntR family transcriptional regulator n=1 Tax=Rhodococcus sp. NPDC060084 TaxID=3347053 RepID=UPI00364D90F6
MTVPQDRRAIASQPYGPVYREEAKDPLLRMDGHRRADEVRRLRDLLRVVVDRLGSGQRMPSDEQLARRFRTSRNCVRLALQALADENRVQRSVGAGTYTTNVHERSRFDLLIDSIPVAGGDPRSELVILGWKVTSDLPESISVDMPADTSALVIFERLSTFAGVPRQLRTYYLALRPGEEFTREDASRDVYDIIEHRFGHGTLGADRRISAVGADESAASALGVAQGTPILYIDTTVFNERRETVLLSHARYRSDMVNVALNPPRA